MDGRLKSARLVAIAVLGFLLLNAPLATIADRDATIAGIPALYAYLFGVWALVIALIALAARD
jgi:presenilin-like A22 family membrane protease